MSDFFCSELSRRSAEKSFGTASTGAVWILLEYPHGWGKRALEDSALSDGVKRFLTDTLAGIRHSRLLFIKTDRGRADARMNLFVVLCRERSPRVVRLRVEDYEKVRDVDLSAVASGSDLQGGEVERGPLYLVCTHGRRDKCCAKFGFSLYNSLRATAGDAVWQSSHVGGDRFAANLVCFPHGLFYAHADETSGRAVVEAYNDGRVMLEKFRGRACYAHHVQAAEFFVRTETGAEGVEHLRFRSSERDGDTWLVKFEDAASGLIHEARVARRMSDFRNFITCHSEEEKPVPQFQLDAYRARTA